jgi:integrase
VRTSPVPRVKQRGAAPAKVEHLSAETVREVYSQAQIAGPHVEALVRLLLAGLRVSEAIRVTPEDLTEEGAQVRDGRTASSHRVVPLPAETRRVLSRFPKGIPVVHGLGGKDGRRHAHLAVARLGEAVGVELSPRMLTGYAIADQLARGVPVHVVQRNAGTGTSARRSGTRRRGRAIPWPLEPRSWPSGSGWRMRWRGSTSRRSAVPDSWLTEPPVLPPRILVLGWVMRYSRSTDQPRR